MPRNSSAKYVRAFDAIQMASRSTKLSSEVINDILSIALNHNRLRMRGLLIDAIGNQENIPDFAAPDAKLSDLPIVRRDLMKTGLRILPAPVGHDAPIRFLADMQSNIFLVSERESGFSKVIVNAHFQKSDMDKVLKEALMWRSSGKVSGAKRSDQLWGDVILHLLQLHDRGSLRQHRSAETLVESVVIAQPGINPASIRDVLKVVVERLPELSKS